MTPHVIISVVQDMLVDFVEREIIANALIKNILRLTYNTMQQRHTQKYNKNFTSPHYPTKKTSPQQLFTVAFGAIFPNTKTRAKQITHNHLYPNKLHTIIRHFI